MAKKASKKKEKTEEELALERLKKKQAVEAAILKEFGKVISSGNELLANKEKLESLSVSPSLDLALNGGLLEGTWNIISGDPKSGKSTTCLQICKNAQDTGRNIIYIDAESRLKQYNLLGVKGLDLEKFQTIHSPEDQEQLSAEGFLKIAESLMREPENKGAVVVVDSCSSLVPKDELEKDPSGSIRATLPKLLAHWVKKNAQIVINNKLIVLIITHYITNTSGRGKTKIPDCGLMIQYQADTRLDIKWIEKWEENDTKIGQLIHWEVGCSAMGASGTSCVSYLRFGKGIDKDREVIELAESFGIIDKSGSWFSISFIEDNEEYEGIPHKHQGKTKLGEFLSDNPKIFNEILKRVNEMLCM